VNDISEKLPRSVDQAVDRLISELSLYDKSMIVNMSEKELLDLQFSVGEYIRKEFRLEENHDLMESCRSASEVDEIHIGHASYTIIKQLWKSLHKVFIFKGV
jgi:hypothetical protein